MKHPYYTMNQYMQTRYGKKMRKICIDGGFTCPNRDGTCGFGGCTFCGARGAGEQLDPTKSIREQAETVLSKAAPDSAWIVYFQNFTNTYAPVSVLKARYDAALFDDRVKVLDIGTRPDCITEEVAALLAEYAKHYEVWVELGLQTANDETARCINRGYPLARYTEAVAMLKRYGLPVITHIIIGLPGETREDVLHTIRVLNAHHTDGVKIHSLFVMRGTQLAEEYARGSFTPITMQEYIGTAVEALKILSPDTVVHRMTGNCLRADLIAPDWIPQRDLILCTIDRIMAANGWTQGCQYDASAQENVSCETPAADNGKEIDSMKKAILFDLDGTLLDTLADLRDSLNAALERFGLLPRSTEDVRRFVGNGIAKLVERAIPSGLEDPLYPAVLAETKRLYALHCEDQTKPYEGILAMLDTLHDEGYAVGVVSNKPDPQVKMLCTEHFGSRVTVAIGSQEGQALKPAPDALLRASAELGTDPAHTIYVGDSDVDVETAANTGVPCISVLWGFRNKPEIERAGGSVFVTAAAEIPAQAARIFGD